MNVEARVTREVYPHTDHGHTWIEVGVIFINGSRAYGQGIAGYCDRLGDLPGGSMKPAGDAFEKAVEQYKQDGACITRTKHENLNEGFFKVTVVCIERLW